MMRPETRRRSAAAIRRARGPTGRPRKSHPPAVHLLALGALLLLSLFFAAPSASAFSPPPPPLGGRLRAGPPPASPPIGTATSLKGEAGVSMPGQPERASEEDDKAMQWDLYKRHHALGSWRGTWTSHDYMGDVVDETVAR